jgi:hypothetical protein
MYFALRCSSLTGTLGDASHLLYISGLGLVLWFLVKAVGRGAYFKTSGML